MRSTSLCPSRGCTSEDWLEIAGLLAVLTIKFTQSNPQLIQAGTFEDGWQMACFYAPKALHK